MARSSILRPPLDDVLREARQRLLESDAQAAVSMLHGIVSRVEGEESRRVRRLLARAYSREPRWQRFAVNELRRLLAEEPADAEALVLLGGIYRREGRLSRAESLLRRAVATDPYLPEAHSALTAVLAERETMGSRRKADAPRRPSLVARLFSGQSRRPSCSCTPSTLTRPASPALPLPPPHPGPRGDPGRRSATAC